MATPCLDVIIPPSVTRTVRATMHVLYFKYMAATDPMAAFLRDFPNDDTKSLHRLLLKVSQNSCIDYLECTNGSRNIPNPCLPNHRTNKLKKKTAQSKNSNGKKKSNKHVGNHVDYTINLRGDILNDLQSLATIPTDHAFISILNTLAADNNLNKLEMQQPGTAFLSAIMSLYFTNADNSPEYLITTHKWIQVDVDGEPRRHDLQPEGVYIWENPAEITVEAVKSTLSDYDYDGRRLQNAPQTSQTKIKTFQGGDCYVVMTMSIKNTPKLTIQFLDDKDTVREGHLAFIRVYTGNPNNGRNSKGHYYCFMLSSDGTWYECNNENVIPCGPDLPQVANMKTEEGEPLWATSAVYVSDTKTCLTGEKIEELRVLGNFGTAGNHANVCWANTDIRQALQIKPLRDRMAGTDTVLQRLGMMIVT